MAGLNAYASSLRGDRGPQERPLVEEGVPFFVPHLAKVKTNVMCQTKNQHLLFCYEQQAATATATTASYRKQGNQDMYTADNLRRRQRLLEDKQVLAAIGRFWDTFPHVRLGRQTLERRDYVDVFVKFFKALVAPSEFSIAEARKIVERDWERDIGDAEAMTKLMFFRALFEVADIWTVGIGADIYISFLNKLYDRVTMTVFDQEKSMWLTVFADLDKVRSLVDSTASGLASSPTRATLAPSSTTNQDQESVQSSPGTIAMTATSPSAPRSKPPLLRKKMMSVPSGIGSPSKASSIDAITAGADSRGGSMRRLPDLQMAADALHSIQGIVMRSPQRQRKSVSERERTANDDDESKPGDEDEEEEVGSGGISALSSRSDRTGLRRKAQPVQEELADSVLSLQLTKSISPTRTTVPRSASIRKDQRGSKGFKPSRRDDDTFEDGGQLTGPPSPPPEIVPQQVRLSMPSIYLSPEITPAQGQDRAARRRIRESMKLAQRLRRITF